MENFFSQHLIKSGRLSRIQAYHCQGRQSRDAFMNGNTESLGLDFVRNIKECWKKIFRQMSARLDCTRLTRREMYGAWWESAMVWVCIVVSGTRSAVLTHYVTADRSARVNSEVYWAVLCAQIQPCFAKLTENCFTVLMDKDPTQSKRKDILFNDQTNHLSMISSYRYCRLNWRQSIWRKETYTIRWWF